MIRPLVLVIAPVIALTVVGCSASAPAAVAPRAPTSSTTQSPTPSGEAPATTPTTGAPTSTGQDASAPPTAPAATAAQSAAAGTSVARFLDTSAEAAADPASPPDLTSAVGGAMLDDLQALLDELDGNGWTSTGTPVATDVRVLRISAKDGMTTAKVEACIDSSDVVVLDADGNPLPTEPATARAITIFTLTDDGTGFLVTDRTYPDNPSC